MSEEFREKSDVGCGVSTGLCQLTVTVVRDYLFQSASLLLVL